MTRAKTCSEAVARSGDTISRVDEGFRKDLEASDSWEEGVVEEEALCGPPPCVTCSDALT